ncbi:VIT family protein [Luteococcus peritonei]|uniref:VIT family protein n=1 Tax=Luteococcus peritonei TaxID=88874 RepID=A0ABW4RZ40_9ACTN
MAALSISAPAVSTETAGSAPLRTERSLSSKLNWLRAGVLGANDGIVSTAGLVMGVAGASSDRTALFIAGMAGLVAGALSMAGGEFVSVSSQKDTEIAELQARGRLLSQDPQGQQQRLAEIYRDKGLSEQTAELVAAELSSHDALAAHAEADLGISADERTSPWSAAWASALSFTLGALIPLAVMLLSPVEARVVATLVAVLVALALTGAVSARLGGGSAWRPMVRNLVVGALAMGLTYGVGSLVGTQL